MTERVCDREGEVLKAVRRGHLDGELEHHSLHCAACADLLMAESLFGPEARTAEAQARLPSAAHVWWRAQRRARERAVLRATLPIVMLEKAALAAGAAVTVLALWKGFWRQGLVAVLGSILEGFSFAGHNGSLVLVGGSSVLLLVLFALYLDWVEG